MNDIEYVYNNAITLNEKKTNGEIYKNFIVNLDENIRNKVMELLPEKYKYLYRGILYNIAKIFKNIMLIDIKINKIYYIDGIIDIDAKILSLSKGEYIKNYKMNLELAY